VGKTLQGIIHFQEKNGLLQKKMFKEIKKWETQTTTNTITKCGCSSLVPIH
jgi:hypothetical protein